MKHKLKRETSLNDIKESVSINFDNETLQVLDSLPGSRSANVRKIVRDHFVKLGLMEERKES